jgi:HEAT repeat protein/MFS family permease
MGESSELSTTGLLADGSQQLDINGRPITPRRRRWGMNINILCAGLGTFFAVVYWPGSSLFSMFMTERLGATQDQVGFFSSIVGIGQLMQVLGVFIFDRTKTRKVLWVTFVLLYRISTFAIVGFALYALRAPAPEDWDGQKLPGTSMTFIWFMLGVMSLTFSMAQMTANAWWSWIADLSPEAVRGRFLGNRQLAATAASLLGALPVVILDSPWCRDASGYTEQADWVFIAIFALCSVSGVIDIIIHAFIPEPARLDRPDRIAMKDTIRNLIAPLKDASFRRFTLAVTLGSFCIMFWAPFVWPYLKDKDAINIDYSMYTVSIVLHCVGQFIGSRYWGIVIDRFGAKPVLAITYAWGLICSYLFFITPANASLLVIVISVASGLLVSGNMLAGAELMLTLAPTKTRNSYVATHACVSGVALVVAPILGGWCADWFTVHVGNNTYQLRWGTTITYMQVLVLVGVVMRLLCWPLFLRIKEGDEKPMGMVLATVLGASQFRTLYAMRMVGGRDPGKKVRAMRTMEAVSDQLAIEELVAQLDDAHPHVRREAVLALGRLGGPEAVAALKRLAADPKNDLQPEAVVALDLLAEADAVLHSRVNELRRTEPGLSYNEVRRLVDQLDDADPHVRREAVQALGRSGGSDLAVAALIGVLDSPQPDLQAEAAIALGETRDLRAVTPLLKKLQDSNEIVREDVAGALGAFRSPAVALALRDLIRSEPSPNVFGRAAAALARLGVMDALWDVTPRLHGQGSVGLLRQLATAVGDLLGETGQYYTLMNEETRNPGQGVAAMVKQDQKALRRLIRAAQRAGHTDQAQRLYTAGEHLKMAMEEYEYQRYDLAVQKLATATMEIVRGQYDFTGPDEVAVEFALSRQRRLGAGLWFMQQAAEETHRREGRDEVLRLDALVGFHFLHHAIRTA